MSFTLLLAVTAAVAASMGYLAARKHGDEPEPTEDDEGVEKKPEAPAAKKKPSPAVKPDPAPFATLPLALGDVVSSATEERWLAGALLAREGSVVLAALFVAPEGVEHKAIAAFAAPRKEVWWLSPADVASPAEPPATIEVGGVAMARKARLPVRLSRHGQGAPDVGAEGLWAVYDRGRDVAVVIASEGRVYAWAGIRLEEGEYDRLGGGGEE
jgi:hypothetical protein